MAGIEVHAPIVEVNGIAYFPGRTDSGDFHLWRSNGTAAGTYLLKNVALASNFSNPGYLANVNGTLFFRGDDGTNGPELWKSDGTSGGTVLVKDIDTGSRGSYPKMLANIGQTLFFTAYDGGSTGLWKTDGTAAGTVRIGTVRPEVIVTIGGPTPPQAAAVNGTLFFRGDDGVNGVELWKSDGTATGTMMVKDIRVSSGTSGIHYVTNVNGTAFFAANDGTSGYELWKSDGTTNNTVLVKDIFPGLGNSPYSSKGPSYFAEVNGKLFFRANDGTHGYELWKSDGSSDGTVLVKDIGAGASSGGIKSLANVSGTLFFASDDGGPGFGEVWKSDSTFDGTVLLKDVLATATVGLAPRYFTNVNGTLLFATSNNHTASELWRSNGTPESTVLVQSFPEATIGASAPHYLVNAGGKLFFAVPDGSGKPRLWTSDGTNSGTILVPQGNASCSTVVININDSGAGSLRDAINCANSSPGTDTISFNIPGAGVHTIALATQLPDLTEAVIIDGYTQPGANANTNAIDDPDATKRGFNGTLLIELSGGGNVPEGLNLANGSTVRGLVINRFGNNGINAGAGCIIEGNFIGTDPTGILDRGNSGNGVSVGGSNNRIGGASPAARNVISTNADYGIGLSWYGGSDETTGNLIAGNFIGIDASGSKALGNKRSGIFFYQVTGNTIGGTQAGARNVISGNANNGVYIVSTIGVTVQGNYIGTDVSGSKPVGNGGTGISIDGFNGNVIGGAAAGAGNVISANQYGIVESAQYDTIQGNLIGTDAAGVAPLGNAHDGIRLLATTGPNQIGGTATGAGNHIAFNGGNGISFQAGYYYPNSGTPILGNSIFSNGGMGIDLGEDGPTVNDVGDPDTGPNNDQNSPVLQSVTGTGGATTTQWSFNSAANTQFRLEFFASAAADPSGYGEGQTFLGSTNVTTDPSGNAATTFSTPTPTGTVFSATATRLDAQGRPLETSEFSYTQLGSPTCNTTVTNTNDTGDGSFRAAILCANSNPGLDTIRFNIPGPGVHTIRPATTLPTITDSVIIDGYTQPGASPNTNAIDDPNPAMRGFNGTLLIELSGNGSISTGLPLGASNSVIRGLVVNSFFSGIGVGGRGNVIEGNFVGLDPTGTKSHANSVIGIDVVGSNHRIGGTTPASRNVVSSNGYDGIRLADFGNGGTGNVIQGNLVGTDLTGTKALGNQPTGVYLYQVGGDTVGGTQSGARNVISGNSTGIYLESSTGNTVQGNFIGVDVSGAKALGNSGAGIAFNVGGATMIGGTTPAARNVISGNGAGIAGYGSENVVQGNFIGTDASGTQPLGNTGSGISILRGSFDDVIGGTASGAANVIAYNGGSGVFIQESYRHSILANSIFSNAGLGIDIDPAGFNPNDPGDADNGANYQQNYPEISSATRSGSTLSLTYVVPSRTTNSTYPLRVEFFKADGDGQEGQTFLGFDTYTAAEAGTAKTIVLAPAIPIGVGNQLVTTATDNRNDTSEFSPGVTVGGANVPPVLVNINGNNSLTASESTVPLTAAPSIDVNLSASDSDFLQTLAFSLVVNPSPPPDCTAYDPSNSAQTSLLQISIPAQTASPGAPPTGTSSATGTLRVTPGPNAAGTWCFIVRTSDGIASDQHEVTLTVTSANSSPVITTNGGGDTANISVKENTTAVTDLDATDLDVEQTITFSIAGGADANKFSINGSTGVLIFASAPDFEQPVDAGSNNVYDVIVQASDGSLSDRQTIAVTVTNVNEPPVIVSNGGGSSASITIAENTTAVTDVDATDPDASTTLTYSKIGGVDSARFSISSTTGVLSFITAPNFESPTDAGRDNVYDVIVRVSDGSLSDTQTISVRVTDVNEPPVIISNGGGATASINLPENTAVVTDVNATADAGRTLVYGISGGADAAKFAIDSTTGVLTLIAPPDFENPGDVGGDNVYNVVVQVADGNLMDTQSIAVTITNINDPPLASADDFSTSEDSPLVISADSGVRTNDTDPDAGDSFTVISVGGGGVLWDEAIHGDLPDSGTIPVLRLAPGANEIHGTTGDTANAPSDFDDFNVEVPEGLQVSSATFSTSPLVGGIRQLNWSLISSATNEGETFGVIVPITNFSFLIPSLTPLLPGEYQFPQRTFFKDGSVNPADLATYTFRFNVTGELSVGRQLALSSGALVTMQADGSFRYDPNGKFDWLGLGQTATDSFTYTVADTQGAIASATVTITIHGQNSPPSATDDSATLSADGRLVVPAAGLLANDTDVDAQDTKTIIAINGQSAAVGQVLTLASGALLTVQADGSYRYDPNGMFEPLADGETAADSFTYTMADSQGVMSSAMVAVTIEGANDAPVAMDDAATTGEDQVLQVDAAGLLANDNDLDHGDTKAIIAVNGVQAAVGAPITLASGAVLIVQVDGGYRYDPNGAFESLGAGATANDYFTYTVADALGAASTTLVTITVQGANDAPVATNDTFQATENNELLIAAAGVLKNDTDVDGDKLIAVIDTLPAHGTIDLHSDGGFRYVPVPNYNGPDSFSYHASDGPATSSTVTVLLSVLAVNDPPVAANDAYSGVEDIALNMAAPGVLSNDSDVDSTGLTVAPVRGPMHGGLVLRRDGSFKYTPDSNFNGPDSFTYQVSDGHSLSNIATASLAIAPVNDTPAISLGADAMLNEGGTLSVTGSFADPDSGDSWTATVDYGDGGGMQPLILAADKSFELSHLYRENGSYNVVVTVQDAALATGTAAQHAFVNNIAPQNLIWSGPLLATRNQAVPFAGSFSDPGVLDTEAASVDWGDGTTGTALLTGAGGQWQVKASHVYSAGGFYPVTLKVTDDDGGVSATTSTVMIVGARLNRGTLEIVGTAQQDTLQITPSRSNLAVNGKLGGANFNQSFLVYGVQRIVANLGEGNDSLKVNSKVKASLLVVGGGGKDKLTAGGGPSVLIGGDGQDQLIGGAKSDLLIGGATAYDNNALALTAILSEWSSSRTLAVRSANLRAGSGFLLQAAEVHLVANETVFNDSDIDTLMGGGDLDWFWAGTNDLLKGRARSEQLN